MKRKHTRSNASDVDDEETTARFRYRPTGPSNLARDLNAIEPVPRMALRAYLMDVDLSWVGYVAHAPGFVKPCRIRGAAWLLRMPAGWHIWTKDTYKGGPYTSRKKAAEVLALLVAGEPL